MSWLSTEETKPNIKKQMTLEQSGKKLHKKQT